MVRGKRHPDSREKRRAATRLPRGAQRFASLPGSLQALTHQQSLPPPVRPTTPLSPPNQPHLILPDLAPCTSRPHFALYPPVTCRSFSLYFSLYLSFFLSLSLLAPFIPPFLSSIFSSSLPDETASFQPPTQPNRVGRRTPSRLSATQKD